MGAYRWYCKAESMESSTAGVRMRSWGHMLPVNLFAWDKHTSCRILWRLAFANHKVGLWRIHCPVQSIFVRLVDIDRPRRRHSRKRPS